MTSISTISKDEKKIEIKISLKFGESMLETEEKIQAALNEGGKLLTEATLENFDSDGSPIIMGAIKYTSKGLTGKTYQTPYGAVRVKRHLYQTSKGGSCFCPLDRDARIILTATPKFAKMISSKYSDASAIAVARDFEENHQRRVTRSFMQNVCDAIGAVAFAKEESWEYELPQLEERITTVSVGLDGTCTHITEEGYRQTMVGTIALFNKAGERQYTIYAAASPEYGKATFNQRFEREIERIKKKIPNATYVGVADGAKDNWTFLEKHTEVQILDFWHASEYLSNAGTALYSQENQVDQRDIWLENSLERLKTEHGSAKKIVTELDQLAKKRKLKSAEKQEVSAAVTYFNNNKHRMNYAKALEENLPIGSGVTEAACKVIVKQRLSNSGMRWSERGAAVVLTLRSLRQTEGRWDQFWGKINRYGYPAAAA